MSDNDQSEDPEAPAPARETVAFVTPQAADASSTVAFVPTTVASPPTPPAPPPAPTPPAPPPSFRVAPPPPGSASPTVAYLASEVASPLEEMAPTVESAAIDEIGPRRDRGDRLGSRAGRASRGRRRCTPCDHARRDGRHRVAPRSQHPHQPADRARGGRHRGGCRHRPLTQPDPLRGGATREVPRPCEGDRRWRLRCPRPPAAPQGSHPPHPHPRPGAARRACVRPRRGRRSARW